MPPSVSVVIPSALKPAPTGELWLDRALRSVQAQTMQPLEIIVGLDPGVTSPSLSSSARFVCAEKRGHQSATNAAVLDACGALFAFLEDDDAWLPNHLELMVGTLQQTQVQFVSMSQRECDADGVPGDLFDFPTASSWLITRLAWMQLGGFDVRFHTHHDNAFLCRMNAEKIPRAHVVEATADPATRPFLSLIARHARILRMENLPDVTVQRTIHDGSLLGTMSDNPERMKRSQKELNALEILYGEHGW